MHGTVTLRAPELENPCLGTVRIEEEDCELEGVRIPSTDRKVECRRGFIYHKVECTWDILRGPYPLRVQVGFEQV